MMVQIFIVITPHHASPLFPPFCPLWYPVPLVGGNTFVQLVD